MLTITVDSVRIPVSDKDKNAEAAFIKNVLFGAEPNRIVAAAK